MLISDSTSNRRRGGNHDPIARGDARAEAGDWNGAISAWEGALEATAAGAAAARIRWLLDQDEHLDRRTVATQASTLRLIRRGRLLLTMALCAALGTAGVFLGQEHVGLWRNLLASLSWLAYMASATLAIAYAFTTGEPRRTPTAKLSVRELERARERARALAQDDRVPTHP